MKNSEVRGQPAVSPVEPRSACGEYCRTDIGLPTFRHSTFRHTNRRGMTLIEVILAIAILAIMAVMAISAFFYPRYLVVTSALEQNAIHAGSAAIEGLLHNYTNSPGGVQCNLTGGWSISDADIVIVATNRITDVIDDPSGPDDTCEYLEIKTTITYRDGQQVELVTYRSLEVDIAPRQLP